MSSVEGKYKYDIPTLRDIGKTWQVMEFSRENTQQVQIFFIMSCKI